MAKMLMAAFTTPEQADRALHELERLGYSPREISVISKHERYTSPDRATTATDTGANVAGSAVTGATTGGVIGGLAGLLAGVGIVPAIAGLFIGGPIAAALGLAGAAATTVSGALTGAAAGGLIGALTGLGLPKETATAYDRTVSEGGVVLGLTGHESTIGEARAILEQHGAEDISELEPRREPNTALADERTNTGYTTQRREPAFGERPSPADTRDVTIDDDTTELHRPSRDL